MTDDEPIRRPTQTQDQRVGSAFADLFGIYLDQPLALSREFDAWICGYRDLGADVLVEIVSARIREAFDDEDDEPEAS